MKPTGELPLTEEHWHDIELMRAEFERQAEQPEGEDERLAACYSVCVEGMEEGWLMPTIEELVYFRSQAKRRMGPSGNINRINKAFQSQIVARNRTWPWLSRFRYPKDFYEEAWREAMQTILTDDNAIWEIREELVTVNAPSTMTWRYEAVVLAMHMFSDRLGPEVAILDGGCSLNLGLKKIKIDSVFSDAQQRYPYHFVEALDENGEPNDELTLAVNALLARKTNMAGGVGVEVMPIHDEVAISYCFRPSEWLSQPERVKETNELTRADVPGVYRYIGDFSADGMEESANKFEAAVPITKFNMVTFLTMWHQHNAAERLHMLEYAKKYLAVGGFVLGQDFMHRRQNSKTGVSLTPKWTDFSYRTMMYDLDGSLARPRELFAWQDSRCQVVKIPGDVGRLILAAAERG